MPVLLRRALLLVIVCALAAGLSATGLAQRASRPAADWVGVLDSPERLAAMKIDEVVAAIGLKPGDVIADLGAGSGPFVVPFARAVTSTGKVYAVEIDGDFFPYIEKRAKEAGVANVRTVLGEFSDPKLPAADVDVAFMHDVLHHVEDRDGYLRNLATYLTPGARIVVIDYHPAQSPHAGAPALQVSRDECAAWLAAAGFAPAADHALFTDKWFTVFARR